MRVRDSQQLVHLRLDQVMAELSLVSGEVGRVQ